MYQTTKGGIHGQTVIVCDIIFTSGYIANFNLVDQQKKTLFHKGNKQEIQFKHIMDIRLEIK